MRRLLILGIAVILTVLVLPGVFAACDTIEQCVDPECRTEPNPQCGCIDPDGPCDGKPLWSICSISLGSQSIFTPSTMSANCECAVIEMGYGTCMPEGCRYKEHGCNENEESHTVDVPGNQQTYQFYYCCPKEEPPKPKVFGIFDMLHGFNIAENLLHNKILFMLHTVKESIIASELRELEIEMASKPCKDSIFSLQVSKKDLRYGHEEEFDALLRHIIEKYRQNPDQYINVDPSIDVDQAEQYLNSAIKWNGLGMFSKARDCKCRVHTILNGKTDPVECELAFDCGPFVEVDGFCEVGCGTCQCTFGESTYDIEEGTNCD